MDDEGAANKRLMHAFQRQAATHDRVASELGAMAQEAEREGELGFADALVQLARLHRVAMINFDAQATALQASDDPGSTQE